MAEKKSSHIDFSKRKFTHLIKNLSEEDIYTFLLYLRVANSGLTQKELEFMEFLLVKIHPNYALSSISLLKQFFENDGIKLETQLNRVLHISFRLLEKWLVNKEVEKDQALNQLLLARAYAENASPKLFNQFMEQAANKPIIGLTDNYYVQYKRESSIFHYPFTVSYQHKAKLKELSGYIDNYYFAQKIKLIAQQLSRNSFMIEQPLISFFKETLTYASQFPNNLYFQLYLQLIKLLQKHDHDLLFEIKRQFEESISLFNREEAAIFLHLLINHVVQQTNARQEEYLTIQFELYQLSIDQDLIIFNNGISDGFFFNIVQAACHVKAYSFAKKFIKKYSKYLNDSFENPLIPFTKATIFFYQNKFEEAGDMLQVFSFKTDDFKLAHKTLHLKCLYEMYLKDPTYYTVTLEFASTFSRYLKNQKVFKEEKSLLYLKFIKSVRQLLKIADKPSSVKTSKKKAILATLEAEDNAIASRNWLLTKVKQIK